MAKSYPPLTTLTELEARSIELMFRVYDYKGSGRIPSHLAKNLFRELGLEVATHQLPPNGTLKDILLIADQKMPETTPPLPGALQSFVSLSGVVVDPELVHDKRITTDSINDFFVSLGRQPISRIEAEQLLADMLDYDDCSATPAVPIADFVGDMSLYARKNALKEEK